MTPANNGITPERKSNALTRRALLLGTGVATGVLGATAIQAATEPPPQHGKSSTVVPSGDLIVATGLHQAGVSRPVVPQQRLSLLFPF